MLNEQRGAAREISNLFIWSGFKYYLRQPTDSYIVFAPVKYFKSVWLVNKEFVKGFAFNRKYFHASASTISCILWGNVEADNDEWILETYDMQEDNIVRLDDLTIRKIHKGVSDYNDRRKFETDENSCLVCESNGYQKVDWMPKKKYAVFNSNIIAYMATNGNSIDAKHRYLTRLPYYVGVEQSFGYSLRRDNYINKLPVFCAKLYPQDEWFETDVYFNTSDKGEEYIKDKDLLRRCLIYTCLSFDNKCRSIIATDGNIYQNELCLDEQTIALEDLRKMQLGLEDKNIIDLYDSILMTVRTKPEYNKSLKYGLYQINTDINRYDKADNGEKIYYYPELNGQIIALKKMLKKYYKEYICDLLFKYELIK